MKKLKELSSNVKYKYYVCDVLDDEKIINVINDISQNYETIDCLINCVGMWISGDMSKVEEANYKEMNKLSRIKKVIDTNVFGVIGMCDPPFSIYNATKQSTNAFRKAIQDDLAQNNIKITDVCPSLIQTQNGKYRRA